MIPDPHACCDCRSRRDWLAMLDMLPGTTRLVDWLLDRRARRFA